MVRHERAPPGRHRFVMVSVVIEVRWCGPALTRVPCGGVLLLIPFLRPWVEPTLISLWLAV
jgi:hypothetical protein